jgi:hypothetical protein
MLQPVRHCQTGELKVTRPIVIYNGYGRPIRRSTQVWITQPLALVVFVVLGSACLAYIVGWALWRILCSEAVLARLVLRWGR